ncbi:uncharacterized protein NEMAJ01_1382 [Nematocida major]|uniref:uncharacterized protein n=1 Tax=Nematocida major TaxID=1912982 RepID=UPI002008EA5A|nr:uncharacterized protein NEMAJ01_1382 [Nematocida major]KAH9386486.1 hypothetical protein NEMAJ01_1382 [Nematocida major]
MKRVRSKKIENDKKLNVFCESDLDITRMQEYTGPALTTGVEKEEEEEHHLKEILSRRAKSIPTPRIERAAGHDVKKRKLSSEEDAPEETAEYLEDIGDVSPPTDVKKLEIITQENDVPADVLPFVCFRKREVKSLRKARKADTSIEKIKKIKVDLQMMRRLTELTLQRDTYLSQHLTTILSIFNICREMNKRLDIGVLNISESILRDILFTKLISKNDLFYKKIPSFTNLYLCRKSIGSLRKLFKSGPPPEDVLALNKKEIDYLNTYY